MRRSRPMLALTLFVLLGGALLSVGSLWAVLLRSLPSTDGAAMAPNMSAPATIERDAAGLVRIDAATWLDLCRAQGFVHGQDRFFQMDAMRRFTAGRLAEVLGPVAINIDAESRRLGFHRVAREAAAQLPADRRAMLDAYAEGVNAGVAALDARAPGFIALNYEPEPWRAEDSVLVSLYMSRILATGARAERMRSTLYAGLPDEAAAFLTPEVSRFDAPMFLDAQDALRQPPIPGPDVLDLRTEPDVALAPGSAGEIAPVEVGGSNAWAVTASRSATGGALLAVDMHLPLIVPNIWHRQEATWGEAGDAEAPGSRPAGWCAGFTLPGIPGFVAGANGSIAWGFTNTTADVQDLVALDDAELAEAQRREEVIRVRGLRGTREHRVEILDSAWGPVLDDRDAQGRRVAMRWTALNAEAWNLALLELAHASTVGQAVAVGRSWRGPTQNLVVADASNNIGWTITGNVPKRPNAAHGRLTTPAAELAQSAEPAGAFALLGPDELPGLIAPADGMVFTANNRTLPLAQAELLGGCYALGVRAGRIETLLRSAGPFDEPGMLGVMLDIRQEVGLAYREAILRAERERQGAADAVAAAAIDLIRGWNGAASADSPGYALVEATREQLWARALGPMVLRAGLGMDDYRWRLGDEPVLRLLDAQPPHLLPPGAENWDALVLDAVAAAADEVGLRSDGSPPPTWGERNRLRMKHPLTLVVPIRVPGFDMPATAQDGDWHTVRVATRRFGASQRMIVNPARPDRAIAHMPGGQSEHPLSPWYRAGHAAWAKGEPTGLLAGEPVSRLVLVGE